jgi:hypothetical protein
MSCCTSQSGQEPKQVSIPRRHASAKGAGRKAATAIATICWACLLLLLVSCAARLTLRPWKGRQEVPLKRRNFSELRGITTQDTVRFSVFCLIRMVCCTLARQWCSVIESSDCISRLSQNFCRQYFWDLVADVREGSDGLCQNNPLPYKPSLRSPAVLPLRLLVTLALLCHYFASLRRMNSRTAKRFVMTFDIEDCY